MSYDPLFETGDILVYKDFIQGAGARSATLLVLDPKPDAGNRISVWIEGHFSPEVFDASRPVRVFQTYLQYPEDRCRQEDTE